MKNLTMTKSSMRWCLDAGSMEKGWEKLLSGGATGKISTN